MKQSLSNANDIIKQNLFKIIKHFGIDMTADAKKYSGCCPIHSNSDNPTALIIYKNTGIWFCNTHHCENIFTRQPFGLVKALLSKQSGWQDISDNTKLVSNDDVYRFLIQFQNGTTRIVQKSQEEQRDYNEKLMFIRQTALLKKTNIINSRENFRRNAIIPSEYYLNRNFKQEILDKYDVGLYQNTKHQFYNRVVVPIYDISYLYIIGYTARTTLSKCLVCGYHHELSRKCPDKLDSNKISKWEHSRGFIKEKCLYNMWFAEPILKDKLIICEGPSHCWKLVEAGFENCVAIFGSSLSKYQANLIRKTSVNKIILPYDNDEAGANVSEQIKRELGNQYQFNIIELPQGDIADLSVKEIQELLK